MSFAVFPNSSAERIPMPLAHVAAAINNKATSFLAAENNRRYLLPTGGHITMDFKEAIEEHWRASEDNNIEVEHSIYAVDAILDYPQSGERFKGRATISAQRGGHPADRHFTVLRISGDGHLWVSECIITYDGVPRYSVSIMQFENELLVHETQYFTDKFSPPPWRAALAEPMPGRMIEEA